MLSRLLRQQMAIIARNSVTPANWKTVPTPCVNARGGESVDGCAEGTGSIIADQCSGISEGSQARRDEQRLHHKTDAGQVVTRKMLCEHLWEYDWEGTTNVIEVHINRLRNKLDKLFKKPLIQTVRGRGYALRTNATTEHKAVLQIL